MTKLEELKAAYEAAGSGAWEVDNNQSAFAFPGWELIDTSTVPPSVFAVAGTEDRFKFITLSHNLMPTLLEAVELLLDVHYEHNEYDDEYWATDLFKRIERLKDKLK